MKKISFIFATTVFMPLHLFAQAVSLPQLLNFDGQLINSATNAPITTAVTVDFEILDGSGTPYCLLYKETQSVTPNADGEFSVKIGPDTGNSSPSIDGNLQWSAIFNNDGQVRSADANYCVGGYTPAPGHARKLRVTVGGVTLSPEYTVAPVPMATVAQTLQGKVASDFLFSTPASNTSVLTGNLRINNNFGLQLTNTSSTNFVTIQSPAALAASYTLLLPMSDGNNGEVLTTDGTGVLSWVAPSGGGAIASVFGRTGTVVSANGDYTAGQITSTAFGSIAAVNVQAAIAELESEKLSAGAGAVTGAMIAASAVTSSHISDGTITNIDINDVNISKIASGTGQYFSYRPNNLACADGEILKWDNTNQRWSCAINFALPSQSGSTGRFLKTDGSSPTWTTNFIEDAGGNIGIGTSAPGFLLHLSASFAQQNIESTGASQPGRMIISSSKNITNTSVGDLVFRNTLNSATAAIKGVTDFSGITNGALVFSTGGASPIERMRINSSGNIGIGTTTPASKLHTFGDTLSYPHLILQGTSSGTYPLFAADTPGTMPLMDLRYTTFAPSLFVDTIGVGINTSAPTASLDVVGNVKLGTTGTVFSASGLCVVASTTYAVNTPQLRTCPGIPATTTVSVSCSPSQTVYGYVTARATGTTNQIEITLGAASSATTMSCMWMAQ